MREMPHNLDAEMAVLGAMLLDQQAIPKVLSLLKVDDFYTTANQEIFRSITDLSDKGRPFDIVILCNEFRSQGKLDKIGGPVYLAEIMDGTASAANVGYYAKILKKKSLARQFLRTMEKMAADVYMTAGENITEILDLAPTQLMEINAGQQRNRDFADPLELTKRTFASLEERYLNKGKLIGLSSGFVDLDIYTSGLQSSDLIIVAGRPGMGKTAFALNIGENVARQGTPVAFFSLEMSDESLMMRRFSSLSGIDSRRLKRGFLGESDWPKLVTVAGEASKTPIYICDPPTLSTLELRARARRLKAEKGIGLLVLDYIQLVQSSIKTTVREQEIAHISRTLKALAKELNIPVIALSQLNRKVEDRGIKKPGLADLRESGAIEQDADLILFLYRDEVYNKSEDNPSRGIAEVIIGKHRNGPTGEIKLRFDEKCTRFADLAGG